MCAQGNIQESGSWVRKNSYFREGGRILANPATGRKTLPPSPRRCFSKRRLRLQIIMAAALVIAALIGPICQQAKAAGPLPPANQTIPQEALVTLEVTQPQVLLNLILDPRVTEKIASLPVYKKQAKTASFRQFQEVVHSDEYRGVTGWSLGKDQIHAVVGNRLIFTNKSKMLKRVIDLMQSSSGASLAALPAYQEARKAAGKKTVVAFVNVGVLKEHPPFREALQQNMIEEGNSQEEAETQIDVLLTLIQSLGRVSFHLGNQDGHPQAKLQARLSIR